MLTQPQMADTLGMRSTETIRLDQVSGVVSSNIGCALHLGALIRKDSPKAVVLHPVSLLAAQLRND